jgi:hypothetical protein
MFGSGGSALAEGDCKGELDVETDVPAGQTVTLNPGDDVNDPIEAALVVFTNGPDSEPATISVCELANNPNWDAGGYTTIQALLTIEVTFQDKIPDNEDTFIMRVMMPFTEADLPVGEEYLGPEATELAWFNTSAWALAVTGNTVNSPGFAETVGDRTTVVGTEQPTEFSEEIGDYGIFWHTGELRGFVWANVDHVSDFSPGSPKCWSDLNGDGIVDLMDYIQLVAAIGPCVDPPVGCFGDIFIDGVVDIRDLAQLVAFWGTEGCFLPPDIAGIQHSIAAVDNSAGDAEWGPGAAGNTHLTWDLRVVVDPDDIDDWWTTTEAFAVLDDPVYGALGFYQHPSDLDEGAPPVGVLCAAFPALEFDSWYIEATDTNPCTLPSAVPGAAVAFGFSEAQTALHAIWADLQNFPPPGPGALPFTIARYTIVVDVDDEDCPDCHLDLLLMPSTGTVGDPILGTIEGVTTHRFGLSNLIPFSFDIIDQCAADTDDDGCVGIIDFLAVLGAWSGGPGTPADIDRDGDVGILDFLGLLGRWGPCTENDDCPGP